MFLKTDYDGNPNCVAFDPSNLDVDKRRPSFGWSFRNSLGVMNHYTLPAFWVSKAQNTRGALVIGEVTFVFRDIPDSQILTFEDLLYEGADIKAENRDDPPIRKVTYSAQALLDYDSVWSEGQAGHLANLEALLTSYKELPEVPEGFDGWYKQSNRH